MRKAELKEALKRLRSSQPFNYLATTSIRALMSAAGVESEGVIQHLHRIGRVESVLPNGRIMHLWSRADDWVSNQIFWRGWSGYEPETAPLFYELASRSRVTLDIGAYVGFFTILAAHANPRGRVFAFEPLSPIFRRLEKNVRLNGLENVSCACAAVSDTAGSAEFFHIPDGMPTSSSLSFEFMKGTDKLTSSQVSTITIDDFVAQNALDKIDFIKIDTESTEPAVLQGGIETLRRDRPQIICEVLKGRVEGRALEEILRPLGYSFYLLTRQGPKLMTSIEGHESCLNYLFSVSFESEQLQHGTGGASIEEPGS
jgi:FkbM family methyltransferase